MDDFHESETVEENSSVDEMEAAKELKQEVPAEVESRLQQPGWI